MSRLRVSAGNHDRSNCPVFCTVPGFEEGEHACLADKSGVHYPCQVVGRTDGGARVAFLLEELAAGEEVVLSPSADVCEPPARVVLVDEEDRVCVSIGDDLFTAYNYGSNIQRPNLYPLVGPGGVHVTRDWPMAKGPKGETEDHPHHKSVWVAYGDVNGVDNWADGPERGRTVHVEFDRVGGGPVFGEIIALGDWVSPSGVPVVHERTAMRFYTSRDDSRTFDVTVDLTPVDEAVHFGDTKEGGLLSVRVASCMDVPRGGRIENAFGGVTEAECWGKAAHWCDYSGPFKAGTRGICIMDHPSSFRHPTRWHVRDYGLMTANPFALSHFEPGSGLCGDHDLVPGESLHFAYRVYVHEGDATAAGAAGKYHEFVAPPSVSPA